VSGGGSTPTPTPTLPPPDVTATPGPPQPQQYPPYGGLHIRFYTDNNGNNQWDAGEDINTEIMSQIKTAINFEGYRQYVYTGPKDWDTWFLMGANCERGSCRDGPCVACCPFGDGCAGCDSYGGSKRFSCWTNILDGFFEHVFPTGIVSSALQIDEEKGYWSYSRMGRIVIEPPSGWKVGKIDYFYYNEVGSQRPPNQHTRGSTTNNYFDARFHCIACAGTQFEYVVVNALVNIVKDNKPPSIAAISVNPSKVCSKGDNSSATIYTYYQDEDGGDRLIMNGSFEESVNYWHFGPINRVISSSDPKFGSSVLEVNQPCPACPSELGKNDYSFYQDVPRTTSKDEVHSWSIFVRSPWLTPISGNLVLWNKDNNGKFHQVFDVFFSTSSGNWQQIKGTGTIGQAGNTLRAQVYLSTGGNKPYHFDGARLVKDEDSGLWTDVQRAYIGLTNCSNNPGEAYCSNFERNLSNYFGAYYNPKTDKVWVAQKNAVFSCSGREGDNPPCPWGTGVSSSSITPDNPITNQNGTVKLTGVRPSVEKSVEKSGRLKIEWDLSFNNLAPGTYNLYGMVNDGEGIFQTGTTNARWDKYGSLTVEECRTDPWLQTQEGDVHSGGKITSKISSTATNPYFSLKGSGGFHGIVSWGGSSLNNPNFGSGQVSEPPQWLANTQAKKKNYEFFYPLLDYPELISPPLLGTITNNDLFNDADGIIAYNGDIETGDAWNIGTKKIVLLTTGNFSIKHKIEVSSGGSLVVVAKENISVDGGLGGVNNKIQGIFITDGAFNSGTGNQQLIVEGGVIAKEFILKRDLEEANFTTPAEKFVYLPHMFLNLHPSLWRGSHIWEELAP